MCSFVFIKEAHTLPAVSSVPWRSTGAVPLREASLAAPLIAPEGHMDPGKRSSAVTAISLVPVSYLALPSSPALPSSRSPFSSLSLPSAPVPPSAPSSAASLSSMGSADQAGHFASLQTVWHLRATFAGEPTSLAEEGPPCPSQCQR